MPDDEPPISSQSWVKKYGLKKQRLDLDTFVKEVCYSFSDQHMMYASDAEWNLTLFPILKH